MEKFLPYFERELGVFRRSCRAFAERYPQLANNLLITGEASADPHIERLIQSTAFLNARISKRLDDDYAKFTEALLGMLYAHYLRPLPAYSIARVDYSGTQANAIAKVATLARGSELKSVGAATGSCKFKTAYDVVIAPVAIGAAQYHATLQAPAALALPASASAEIAIRIDCVSATLDLQQLGLRSLRVFIDGEPSLRAALRDTLFMRVARAYVEMDGDGRWIALDKPPIGAVGFSAEDALIPYHAAQHPAYRLLTEYFSYPEKFNFFDLDLATMLRGRATGCRSLTLHLALTEIRADTPVARQLKSLSANMLLLACTPVINLFKQAATPIRLTHTQSAYPLMPDQRSGTACDIYSIDAVHLLRSSALGGALTEFTPFYSLRHDDGGSRKGHYWTARRDDDMAALSPGHEHSLAFVDRDFAPVNGESGTVSVALTCSNRDLPAALRYGLPGGDLGTENGAGGHPIRLLRKPTASRRLGSARGSHWGLIAHLALNHRSLTTDGLAAFAAMLRLYAPPDCAVSQRQIDGIADLAHAPTSARMRERHGIAYVNGVEVRVTLDEQAFVGTGLHAFAQLLDHFFGLYVHLNSFTELVLLSKTTGKELLRCPPRNGALPLV